MNREVNNKKDAVVSFLELKKSVGHSVHRVRLVTVLLRSVDSRSACAGRGFPVPWVPVSKRCCARLAGGMLWCSAF